MLRFQKDAEEFLAHQDNLQLQLGEWLEQRGYSEAFRSLYIFPVCAAIWSCPTNTAAEFPAMFILRFMKNHHMLQIMNRPLWNTVTGRSHEGYVKKVTEPFRDKIRCSSEIVSISRSDSGSWILSTAQRQSIEFSSVIFAGHAPETLKLVKDVATPEQVEYLAAFDYVDNDIWLHRDSRLLPKRKAAWSSWNFLGDSNGKVSVSYWLDMLQNLGLDYEKPIVVTLNPPQHKLPKDDLVVERFIMSHPVPSTASVAAQRRTKDIQGINGLYFCGAWQEYGFHEDGVRSGLSAAQFALGNRSWAPIPNHPRMKFSSFQSASKLAVMNFLRSYVITGRLQVVEAGGDSYVFGNGQSPASSIFVKDPAFYISILLRFDLGVADSYIDKHFECQDLFKFISVLIANRDDYRRKNNGKIGSFLASATHLTAAVIKHRFFKKNTPSQARKNISDHYDLSNDLFKLILDKSMTYSSGIYLKPSDTLFDAQQNKLLALIRKARVRPTDRVLEIGFGWGSLSILLAKTVGCRVTGITLSSQQKAYAEDLVKKEGLEHLIDYHLIDYRLFAPGYKYDRILSCEMLEAVGHEFYGDYFANAQRLMKEDGIFVLQVITLPDFGYDEYKDTVDFIKEYIFPGCTCPAVADLALAIKSRTELVIEDVDNIGPHYARTLREWYDNMMTNKDEILALPGFDERFIRIWQYYFKYCEAGFGNRVINDLQIVVSRPRNHNLDIVPDY